MYVDLRLAVQHEDANIHSNENYSHYNLPDGERILKKTNIFSIGNWSAEDRKAEKTSRNFLILRHYFIVHINKLSKNSISKHFRGHSTQHAMYEISNNVV